MNAFWDGDGGVPAEFLGKRTTINSAHCDEIEVEEKFGRVCSNKNAVILHHNNTTSHAPLLNTRSNSGSAQSDTSHSQKHSSTDFTRLSTKRQMCNLDS
jgi:hypothetical protein